MRANLKLATFSPSKVDVLTGTIPYGDVVLKDEDWLWYLYPLPRHLQFGATDTLAAYADDTLHALMKMRIAVVHSTYFREVHRHLRPDVRALTS